MFCDTCKFYKPSTAEYAGSAGSPRGYCEFTFPPVKGFTEDHPIRWPDTTQCDLHAPILSESA